MNALDYLINRRGECDRDSAMRAICRRHEAPWPYRVKHCYAFTDALDLLEQFKERDPTVRLGRPLDPEDERLIRKRAAEHTPILAVADRKHLLAELNRIRQIEPRKGQ